MERRLQLPENADKRGVVRVHRTADDLSFLVQDEGPGFSWQDYIEVSPERLFDNHGRGIAMASTMSFDRVEYRGAGNEVLATVLIDQKIPEAEPVTA